MVDCPKQTQQPPDDRKPKLRPITNGYFFFLAHFGGSFLRSFGNRLYHEEGDGKIPHLLRKQNTPSSFECQKTQTSDDSAFLGSKSFDKKL
jgi:hypothetical protein